MAKLNRKDVDLRALFRLAVLAGFLSFGLREWWAKCVFTSSLEYPLDYNGFYYLQELSYRQLHREGYYARFSVFFSIMHGLARLLDLTPLQTINIAVCGSLLLFAVAVSLLGGLRQASLFSGPLFYLCLQSEPLFFFHYSVPRQSFAVACAAFGFALIYPPVAARPAGVRYLSGILLMTLSAGCHIFAASLSLTLLLFPPPAESGQSALRRLRWSASILALIFAGFFLYYSPKPVLSNLTLESGLPWNSFSVPNSIGNLEKIQYQVYFGASLLLFAASLPIVRSAPHFAAVIILYFCLIAPIWNRATDAFWLRFLMSSSSPFFIALALASSLHRPAPRIVVALSAALLFILRGVIPPGTRGLGPSFDYRLIEHNAAALQNWIPEDGVVEAPPGVQYMLTYFLGRKATSKHIAKPKFLLMRKDGASFGCIPPKDVSSRATTGQCIALSKDWIIAFID